MERFDQDMRQTFKEEADQNLFGHIHFDERMKESIRQRVDGEKQTASIQSNRNSLHFTWKKWFAAATVAAAMVGFVALSGWLQSTPEEPPMTTMVGQGEGIDQPDGPSTDLPDDPSTGPTEYGTFVEREPGTQSEQSLIPFTLEEAQALFGEQLKLPLVLPKGFELHEILSNGHMQGEASVVEIHYAKDNEFFKIIESKQLATLNEAYGKIVDIHGVDGYLRHGNQGDMAEMPDEIIVLEWYMDGIQYTLTGSLSEDEAITVANSMTTTFW